MQFVNDLQEFSIDSDKFDYDKYKNSKNKDFDISDLNCDNAEYIITPEIKTSQNALCKVYNPKNLIKCRTEDPKNKVGQPWYAQLQVLRESFLLRELNHPAIIKYIGLNLYNDQIQFVGNDEDDVDYDEDKEEEEEKITTNPTLFLEYAGMKSLQYKINSKGKLDLQLLTPVKRQICIIGIAAAVKYLHSNNIVHRNLSPVSIWLDKNLYPKIFDFSHSREVIQDESEQASVTYNGSNQTSYQAPEVFEKTIDYKFLNSLDIFSLGRLLYLMLTGYEPFKVASDPYCDKGAFQLQSAIIKGEFPVYTSKVPENWQKLLGSCWSTNPSDRPSAAEIYKYITEKEEFLISNFSKSDRSEIIKYVNMIKKYENNNKNTYQVSLEISKAGKFHIEESDNQDIIEENLRELDKLLDNNIVEKYEKRFLDLVTDLASTKVFFNKNYLPKVMKYIDIFLEDNYSAKNFINEAFGKPVSKNNDHLRIGDTSKEIEVLNISSKITKISSHAFSGYDKLERVFIPDSVRIIEDEAFSECKQLKYVYLPKSITGENLGKGVFKNCPKLNNVIIPVDLTTIQESTFEGDKKLKEIKLNEKLLNINDKAFSRCSSLKSINIPESVISIGKDAFQSCKRLKKDSIIFPGVSGLNIFSIKHGVKYSAKKQ